MKLVKWQYLFSCVTQIWNIFCLGDGIQVLEARCWTINSTTSSSNHLCVRTIKKTTESNMVN
jgi:hypothetical protein